MEPEGKISKMDALLFVINLEIANLQIRIVEGCSKYNELYRTANSKRESLQRSKLVSERRTLLELIEDGEWSALQESVVLLNRNISYETQLRRSNEELKTSLDVLCTKLMNSRRESKTSLRDCERNIALLKDKIKDTILNTHMQLNYVEKWLLARAESLDLEYRHEITLRPRLDYEKRVHEQVIQTYELQIKERESSLHYWKARYTKDIADISVSLEKQREELKEAVDRRTELQSLYDMHEGEMRAWLNFKQERATRLAREERSRLAATRIQAWWRGIMVRRCIGVFRQLKNTKKLPTTTKLKKK